MKIIKHTALSYDSKEPDRDTKLFIDTIYNQPHRNEALNLTNAYFDSVNKKSWSVLSPDSIDDVLRCNIPSCILKCKDMLAELNIEWCFIDDLILTVSKLDRHAKKIVLNMLYYMKFIDTSITDRTLIDAAKTMHTNNIRTSETMLIPLNYKITCPNCNSLYSINKLNHDYSFDINGCCTSCGRNIGNFGVEQTIDGGRKFKLCDCNDCSSEYNIYIHNLNTVKELWISKATKQLSDMFKSTALINSCLVDDSDLMNYYMINKNSLSKTSRLILSMTPKNMADIEKIIQQILESKYSKKYNANYYLEKLKEDKIVISKKIIPCFLENSDSLSEKVKVFVNKLTDCFCSFITDYEDDDVMEFWQYDCDKPNQILYNLISIKDEITIFNKFFVENDKELCVPTRYNVLKSKAESCEFDYLRKKYTNYTVIPNYPLSQITSMQPFSVCFDKNEIQYLRKCIFDFIVIDNDGYVVKIIEVQKGEHHDKKEWIIKDKLKRDAIKVLGIPFEETF